MGNILQQVIYFTDRPLMDNFVILLAIKLSSKGVNIMFGYLPEAVKQQVIYYLQNDNFRAAKEIYDTWLNDHQINDSGNQ